MRYIAGSPVGSPRLDRTIVRVVEAVSEGRLRKKMKVLGVSSNL